MKALLIKDLAIMKNRGKMLLFMIAWGIAMMFFMEDSSFVVGWLVMIATISAVSTISYDEHDNCMPFLMSMPVSRRDYALEKYLFSAICGAVFLAISLLIVIAVNAVNGKAFSAADDLNGILAFLPVVLVILSVSIPPQLKWGAEKGRTAMMVIFGVIFLGGIVFSEFGSGLGHLAGQLGALSMKAVISAVLAVSLILTALSILISIRIMENKEF